MNSKSSKQRIYAGIMILLACIVLFRTLRMMLVEGAFEILVLWAIVLLILEFLIDLGCLLWSIKWIITGKRKDATIPLWLAAIAAIVHAVRVLIYVLGRTGPWVNFDVKPEHRDAYTFEWFWIYFAGILATLGVIGVIVIWQILRNKEKRNQENK